MSEQPIGRNPLGITFLVLGLAMTVTFSLTLGPAFIGLGAPFIVLGIIFMGRKQADEAAEGDK
mgnify:CR=1 FL=1